MDWSWIVESVATAEDVNPQYEAVKKMIADREFDALRSLAAALDAIEDPANWAVQDVFDRVEDELALHDDIAAARAVLSIIRGTHKNDVSPLHDRSPRARWLASRLGFAQKFETLNQIVTVLSDECEHETVACWVQEHVLRHGCVPRNSHVARYWLSLKAQGHQLTELPLELLPAESGLAGMMPEYHSSGAFGVSLPFGPTEDSESTTSHDAGSRALAASVPVPDDTARVFDGWLANSNGVVETRAWEIRSTPNEQKLIESLRTLQVPALDVPSEDDIRCRQVSFAEALEVLFAAACNGGAYGGAALGAHARLHAWRSVAGFIRAQATDLGQLESQAADATWFLFESTADWFEQVAWDIGIICIPSDRRTLTMLAATDTD